MKTGCPRQNAGVAGEREQPRHLVWARGLAQSPAVLLCFLVACPGVIARAVSNDADWALELRTALSLQNMGDYAGAEKRLTAVLGLVKPDKSEGLLKAVVYNNLGSVYYVQDKYSQAEWAYRRAVEFCRLECGPEPNLITRFTVNLAELYLETRQYDKAERLDLGSLASRFESARPVDRDHIRLLGATGDLALEVGRYGEAETALQSALAGWNEIRPLGDERVQVLNNLGILYHRTGRDAEALELCRRALDSVETVVPEGDPRRVKSWLNVGVLSLSVRGPAEAEPFLKKAVELGEDMLGPEDAVLGHALAVYAKCLRQMNRKGEAKVLEKRSKAILARRNRLDTGRYVIDLGSLWQKR